MSASPAIVRVKWKSRTAGFDRTAVDDIVQKARGHFRLRSHDHEYILLGDVHGTEVELTDDMLKYLPNLATVTLSRVSVCDSDEDTHAPEPVMETQYARAPAVQASRPASTIARSTGSRVRRTGSSASRTSNASQHKELHHVSTWGSIPQSPRKPSSWRNPPSTASSSVALGGMTVNVMLSNGEIITVPTERNETIDGLKETIESLTDIKRDYQRLIFLGRALEDGRTLSDYNIQRDNTLDLVERLRGGKPVIYILPPHALPSATVSVRLVLQWSFSHVYPLAPTTALKYGKQSVTWSVSADIDGTLVEKKTGLELSYLFWEALSNGDATPPSPPLTPEPEAHDVVEQFDPSCPSLEPHYPTTVLLPFPELLPYLDSALKGLTLHTAARNDFITYWLPALSKKPFVAFRFLPQPAYERAAELEVTPAPDVTTRVFMLFRGVSAEDAESEIWTAARDRAGEVDWPTIVGLKAEACDRSRFRVLEWGGMEVL